MVSYTFSHTAITRIFATPFPHNIASIRALEKNGFFLEARFEKTLIKHGQLMDELVYAIRRSEIPFY
jgi:RimJ/RimL family protein N-acetyltransferase